MEINIKITDFPGEPRLAEATLFDEQLFPEKMRHFQTDSIKEDRFDEWAMRQYISLEHQARILIVMAMQKKREDEGAS